MPSQATPEPMLSSSRVEDTVRQLLDEAKQQVYRELIERRSKVRYPFFRPVTLSVDQNASRRLSVFTRDISRSGVGLLHNMPLEQVDATLTIPSDYGNESIMRIRIAWCRPCGEGWYVSGAEFLGLAR
jgi:hypothetical protein